MCSILFKLGPITIYSYGTLVAIGFLVAIFIARKKAKEYKLNPDKITDIGLYVLIAGLIGARLFYVLTEIKSFKYRPFFDVFKVWEGGLVFYGGLIAGILVGIWYVRKIKYSIPKILDIVAPSIAIAQTFGRLGCFMNGCCFGKVDNSLGVIFPSIADNLPHIPTQLIESLWTFIIFLVLIKIDKHKRFEGEVFLFYLILYSFGRFLIEIIRVDERGPVFFGILSVSQIISIILFIPSIIILIKNETTSRQREHKA